MKDWAGSKTKTANQVLLQTPRKAGLLVSDLVLRKKTRRVDERPSFRRRRDVLRLFAAVLAPWLLLAVAIIPALVFRELYRAGWDSESAGNVVAFWFYLFSIAAFFIGVGLFFVGVGRLVWYRAYRRSVYGWVWPLLMYVSTVGLGPATGH